MTTNTVGVTSWTRSCIQRMWQTFSLTNCTVLIHFSKAFHLNLLG